jgi:branched-chain amino acid transport system ATP-binding protein
MSQTAARASVLEARGLTVRYGAVVAVRDVSLEVLEGEIVAIVGPNGAGKSSLLSAIAGLARLQSGDVRLGGRRTAGIPVSDIVRLGAALTPEGRNIFTTLTVQENLKLGATIRRDAEVVADIEGVFREFPILAERRRQPAGLLSGGEQQMLAIARALMSRPRLLMLDEPSLGLAPLIVEQVYDKLRAIRERGVAILVVEQNPARAFAIADRAHVMSHGRLTLSGRPAEIAAQSSFDAAYFGVSLTAGATH